MVSKYLFWELVFLAPLVLAVAVPVLRRNETEELRFFWTAVAVSVTLIAGNLILMPHGIGFPASVAFLLIVVAYAIHPSLTASIFSTLLGAAAVIAAGAAAATYADSHVGSFADRNQPVFMSVAALVGGISTVIFAQIAVKSVARHKEPANKCVNRSGESDGI